MTQHERDIFIIGGPNGAGKTTAARVLLTPFLSRIQEGGWVERLNSDELHELIHRALDEVDRRLASGNLDHSGRFYTDEELAAGAATGRSSRKPEPNAQSKAEDPAA